MPSNGVDLIDEDDAGRIFLALLKQVAHAARTYADKHLDKIRAGNRKEGNISFARDRSRQQRLARTRRSDQQHALRHSPAQLLELLRILQELDNLLQLFLGLVRACDILEGGLLLLRGKQPRAGLAKTQRLVSARLHLPHQKQAETNEKNQRGSVQKNQYPVTAAHFYYFDRYALVAQGLGQPCRILLEYRCVEFAVRGPDVFPFQLVAVRRKVHGYFFDVAGIDLLHELAVAGFILARLSPIGGHQLPKHHAQEDDRDPKENCFCRGARIHVVLTNPATCRKKTASCLFLPALDTFPKRPICSGGKLPEVAPRPVGCRKAIADPHLVRCGAEAKVIRLQGYSSLPRLIQQHCQPDRARPAFAQPPQQKFLCHTAFQNRVDHQHISAFQLRPGAKKNLAPRVPAILDVPHFFAHEVTNNRRVDLPH